MALCLLSLSCSLPKLETADCADATEAVREFYSFHYSNDIAMSPDNLKAREKYLSPRLYEELLKNRPERDYFTDSQIAPKAFKVAECRAVDENTANVNVHLFWKPDERNAVQREAEVEAVKQDGKWLVDKVSVH
jgi:hypothetical protein